MLRISALAVVVLVALTFSRTTSAQKPQPQVPVPADDEIVFVGRVPVEPGTTITLRTFTLSFEPTEVCDDSLSFSGKGDSSGTSSFILIFEIACFQEADAAFICWDPGPEFGECDVAAYSPASLKSYFPSIEPPDLVSFDQLGEVIDIGLLPGPRAEVACVILPEPIEQPVLIELPTASTLLSASEAEPDTIVLGGWVPVPPGTTISLTTFDSSQAVLELEECGETVSLAGDVSRDDVSEFLLVVPGTCLYENTGVVCWGPGPSTEYCSLQFVDRSSLGQTLDLGLLHGIGTTPSGTCILPSVGTGTEPVQGSWFNSLTWLALVVFSFGLFMSGTGLILVRR